MSRPPHLSSCRRPTAVWCFPRRDFHSDLGKVCQDATSYRASHLTAAETLPVVIRDDTWCSNTDTPSWDLSQQGKTAKCTRRKAFIKLYFQGILTFSYTLYYVTLRLFLWILQPFSIYRGFYLKFYLNSCVLEFRTSHVLPHLSFGALKILHSVCQGGELYLRSYFFLSVHAFFTHSCSKNGWFPQSENSEDFLKYPRLNYTSYQSLVFIQCKCPVLDKRHLMVTQ